MNVPKLTLFHLLSAFLIGCVFFLVGFFPVDIQKDHSISSSEPPTTLDGISLKQPKRQVSNVILMIVDAFRYDFLSKEHMPHTSTHCSMKLKTNIPTVTMPRIKSLTSGTISSFIDIILNLGSSQPLPDSILHRLHSRGDVILFFGDDSWIKLFSSHIKRYETNSDSFFIQEFYEADAMITKNLRLELKDLSSWDFMVLHYIGLDRIGHVEGSTGEKINLKLKEMDDVVDLIDKTFSKMTSDPRPLLLVTGDHGMREGGGHGGSSLEEIYVPLIASNRSCSTKNNQVLEYNQVDIAPTLAVLMGVAIPSTSIGCIIPEFLETMSDEEKLYILYYNNKFLVNKAIAKFGENYIKDKDYYHWYTAAKDSHKSYITTLMQQRTTSAYLFENARLNYIRSAHKISELFANSYVRFDFEIIAAGVAMTTVSTIVVLLTCITVRSTYRKISNRGVYYGCICIVSFTFSLICCIFRGWTIKRTLLMNIEINVLIHLGFEIFDTFKRSRLSRSTHIPLWVICGIGFHTFSLCSTSFIEEEHQAWYYMGSTLLLILMGANISSTRLKVITLTSSTLERDILLFFSVLQPLKKSFIAFAMMIFLRRLNQTGDKWINLPDIGDWFAEQKNTYISVFLLLSLILLVFQLRTLNTPSQTIACIVACSAIYSYRGVTDAVVFFQTKHFNSIFVLPLFWISAIYVFASSYWSVFRNAPNDAITIRDKRLVRLLGTNLTVFSLISALLHKPHNVILVFALNFVLSSGYKLCDNLGGPKRVAHAKRILVHKVVLTIWISKMFYFYQGNSNNLGTIDLNPGYIGLTYYNPFIVGLMITANTYFAEIYGFLHLILNIVQRENEISIAKETNEFENHVQADDNYSVATKIMAAIKLSITSVYLILMIAFRHHLFIFTVFSPKVLYECFSILLFYVNYSMTNLYFRVLHKTLKI